MSTYSSECQSTSQLALGFNLGPVTSLSSCRAIL